MRLSDVTFWSWSFLETDMEFFSYLEGIENATETRGDKQININIVMKNVPKSRGWKLGTK